MRTYDQPPSTRLDHHLDWSQNLEGGDFIVSSTWTVPEGITLDGSDFGARETLCWLRTGAAAGSVFLITNSITTAQGREDKAYFYVRVKEP